MWTSFRTGLPSVSSAHMWRTGRKRADIKIRFKDPENGKVLQVWQGNGEFIGKKKKDPEGETWEWHVLCYPASKDPHKQKEMECFDLELVHDNVRDCEQAMEVMVIDQSHGEE